MNQFDLTAAKKWCTDHGIPWDADAERHFTALADEIGLTAEQADRLAMFHAYRVAWLFNPPAYRWFQRIGLAVHFLVGRAIPAFRQQQKKEI